MTFEVGNHTTRKPFKCSKCAERFYLEIEGKKYLKDCDKNIILLNTYGWENN